MRSLHFACVVASVSFACVGDDNIGPTDSGSDVTANDTGSDVATTDAAADVDAGPWTPAVLDADGSLALWLQASPSNITTSNNLVEKWSDLSKNHNDAINSTTGPVVDPAAVNGHDALTFDNVTLTITDRASLRFGTDQFFVAAVAKDTALGALAMFSKAQTKTGISGTTFYQGFELIGTSAVINSNTSMVPLARFAQDLSDAGTSTIQNAQYDAPVWDDGKFHVVGARRPNSSILSVYADGKMVTNSATESDDVSVAGTDVRVGAVKYGKVVQSVTGDIAEVIVVHAPIVSDATVANVLDYLKTRYAL